MAAGFCAAAAGANRSGDARWWVGEQRASSTVRWRRRLTQMVLVGTADATPVLLVVDGWGGSWLAGFHAHGCGCGRGLRPVVVVGGGHGWRWPALCGWCPAVGIAGEPPTLLDLGHSGSDTGGVGGAARGW